MRNAFDIFMKKYFKRERCHRIEMSGRADDNERLDLSSYRPLGNKV